MSLTQCLKSLGFIIKPVSLLIFSFFFDRKYLTGRFFDPRYAGYFWALKAIWQKNILRLERPMPWPTGLTCVVSDPKNIDFHPDDLNNFQSPGTYFQNFAGRIRLGKGVYIAPNVGIITANHDTRNLDEHLEGRDVVIGERCWIGMNSVILPGVTLGPGTIVAAGSVVTRSFPQGGVVVAGVPAKVVKQIESKTDEVS